MNINQKINNIINDGIYYADEEYQIYNDGHRMCIYKGETCINQVDVLAYCLFRWKDEVFYTSKKEGFKLFAYDLKEGTSRRILNQDVRWPLIKDEVIYFTSGSQNYIYSYDLKTTNVEMVCPTDSNYLLSIGDDLFFSNWSDGKKLYRFNLVNGELHKISDLDVAWINYYKNDYLVFRSWNNWKTYCMNYRTGVFRVLNKDGASFLLVRDEYIYYCRTRDLVLVEQNIQTKDKRILFPNKAIRINSTKKGIYFQLEDKTMREVEI